MGEMRGNHHLGRVARKSLLRGEELPQRGWRMSIPGIDPEMGGNLGCERSERRPLWMGRGWRGREEPKIEVQKSEGDRVLQSLAGQCKDLCILF